MSSDSWQEQKLTPNPVKHYRLGWDPAQGIATLKTFLVANPDLSEYEVGQVLEADHAWRWEHQQPVPFECYIQLQSQHHFPHELLLKLFLKEVQQRATSQTPLTDLIQLARKLDVTNSNSPISEASPSDDFFGDDTQATLVDGPHSSSEDNLGSADDSTNTHSSDSFASLNWEALPSNNESADESNVTPYLGSFLFDSPKQFGPRHPSESSEKYDAAEGGSDTEPPREFGDYELLKAIKAGGMGMIFQARQKSLNRIVALKLILAGRLANEQLKARFRTEAQSVARLKHPGIVPVYDSGEYQGWLYFSMEFVEGSSWADLLQKELPTPKEAAQWILQIAEAMEYAHQQGILHRDLKPDNIMVASRDQPRVTDFGLARSLVGDNNLTQSGHPLGTPSYMPPEQAEGKLEKVDRHSDVYSIGATLYELLTGRPPFRADHWQQTIAQVLVIDPVPPRRLNPAVPVDLDVICLKCLEKDPESRYRTAAELVADLQRFLDGRPIHARPVGRGERLVKWAKRHSAIAALLALAAVLTFTGLGGIAWKWREANANATRLESQLYLNQIALAEREWSADRVRRADAILDDCRPSLRHWEWGYLRRLCHEDSRDLTGHDGAVSCCAFHPDDQRIASAGHDRTIRLWDVNSGQETAVVSDVPGMITALSFSPDGRHLVSAGSDHVLRLWDADNLQQLRELTGHTDIIRSVCFDNTGERFASASADGTVRLWDVSGDSGALTLDCAIGTGWDVTWSPSDQLLAVAEGAISGGGGVVVWETATGRKVTVLPVDESWIQSVAFSSDESQLAAVDTNGVVSLWNSANWQRTRSLTGNPHSHQSLGFASRGQRLVSASGDPTRPGQVLVWNVTTEQVEFRFRGCTGSAAVSRNGQLVVAPAHQNLRVWPLDTASPLAALRSHDGWVHGVAIDAHSRSIAVAGDDGCVRMTDVSANGLRSLACEKDAVLCAALSPDRRRLAYAGKHSLLKLWDLANDRLIDACIDHAGSVHVVDFSPDGRLLASAGDDTTIRIWRTDNARLAKKLHGHGAAVTGLAFSPHTRTLFSCSHDQTLRLWDLDTGEVRYSRRNETAWFNDIALAPDGETFATANENGHVQIWDASSGEPIQELTGHTSSVAAVAFHPDGGRVASGSYDGTVKLWDPVSGSEVLTLRRHAGGVSDVAFSPDGTVLLSSGYDGIVRFWRTVAPTVQSVN